MTPEPLRASEAARRLEMSTKELLRLVYNRETDFVMIDGMAHIPPDAIESYTAQQTP